jgi:hypothetical protein
MSISPSADRLLVAGGVVTAVGLVLTLVAIAPLIFSGLSPVSWLWFAAMTTGVGLVVMFAGIWRSARTRGQRARALSKG